jgi:hypothetical protein
MLKFNPNRPIKTRDGMPARIICTNRKGRHPIVALVCQNDEEAMLTYSEDGRFSCSYENENRFDLINVALSSEEYAAEKGAVCPVCGSDENLDACASTERYEEGRIREDVSCRDCGATWTDEYLLAGYRNLKTNEEDSE